MDQLKLLITDNSLLITEKGNTLLEKTFSTTQECFDLISPIVKKRKKSHIECLFSGSKLISQTRTIHFSQPDPFTADEHLLEKLSESAAQAFLLKNNEIKSDVVVKVPLIFKLNGYEVPSLKKQKINDFEAVFFFAALPSDFKKGLIKALEPLSPDHISFEAFSRSISERISKVAPTKDFMTCSAYEYSTDISVTKSNGLFETYTIPLGTHHVLEYVTANPDADAGMLSFQMALDVEIKKALTTLSEGISLPCEIYLLVAPTFEHAYDVAFKSDSYHSLCFSEKGFEVKKMSSILTT